MTINEHPVERLVRVVVGLAVISLFFVLEGDIRYFALLGMLPVITGVTGMCPLYALLGISTVGKKKRS